jgi:hypothetical protein
MQQTIQVAPKAKNYDFVDSIRGIAMISIVAEHAIFFDDSMFTPKSFLSLVTFDGCIQLIKFGTICFFLLAGFLIGEKFMDYSPAEYLKRRVKNTFMPWIFWSLLFVACMVLRDYMNALKFANGRLDNNYGSVLAADFKAVYLFSSYWFIPNFLICISVLLLFRKYLYSNLLGAILLFFTSIYIINIYYQWVEPRHSTAVLGFVFFLWLGAQFNKNYIKLEAWIQSIPFFVWIALAILTFSWGIGEEVTLKNLGSIDPYNSLRISNICYSLVCFFTFLRIRKFNFINKFLKPRETTYGIYLIHYILVALVLPELFIPLRHSVNQLSILQLLGYQLLRFLIIYLTTYFLVRLINLSKLKWSVGR